MSSYSEGQTHQLADAMETAGLTAKHLTTLGQSGTLLEKLRMVLEGLAEIIVKPILELIKSDVKVSARECFVVADHFKKGNAGIYFISENFEKWFGEKVEENISAATLSSWKLMRNSVDGPIKVELGDGHETFLAWLFEKIEIQSDGRKGELLTNGYANIFYVDGRVVYARWHSGYGWLVSACGVTRPRAWLGGYRVFSRNSVLVSSETLETASA